VDRAAPVRSPLETMTRCRIDHTAIGAGGSIELCRPVGQVETRLISDVAAVLSEADAAARRGRYVAGFVAYEAAPAFDAAFRVNTSSPMASSPMAPSSMAPSPVASSSVASSSMEQRTSAVPLAWFGLFAEAVPAPVVCSSGAASSRLGATGHPPWECEVDANAHASAIGVIRGTIADGHAYLVNYTTRFRRPWSSGESAFELYCRLLVSYTSGYHAFFETDQWAVACGSPELFFEQCGTSLVTRPMKGTTPRGRWAEEDIRRAEELRASPKERAENVMVVDLLRNDLGRIAVPGSVAVPSLWQLEQHPALWQLTSTVTASAREGVGLT
jgi:para-aminobenzoate synthetase / 4-amino-4-deoxychorismate lyase